MAQFTITGMREEELVWIKEEMARQGFPGSIVVRNLINRKRLKQAKERGEAAK